LSDILCCATLPRCTRWCHCPTQALHLFYDLDVPLHYFSILNPNIHNRRARRLTNATLKYYCTSAFDETYLTPFPEHCRSKVLLNQHIASSIKTLVVPFATGIPADATDTSQASSHDFTEAHHLRTNPPPWELTILPQAHAAGTSTSPASAMT
jgi:hypothetical protein